MGCIVGPNDNVMVPKDSTQLDWEVELVVVIGSTARHVAEKDANLARGRRLRGTVLDADPKRDLALIELETLPAGVTALKLAADSASPRPT